MQQPPQLDLFADAAGPAAQPVWPTTVPAGLMEVAAHMPAGIYLGTSSWHFPGWATLVYDRPADERTLAREGLKAYAAHPLLKAVGIDRTFYAPLTASEFRQYAAQVGEEFRFVVKAPMLCTAPTIRTESSRRATPNPQFLDADFALESFVEPCLDGLEDKAGPLVFQFPPLAHALAHTPQVFATRLRAFLERLPPGPVYAVELRDRELLTEHLTQVFAVTRVSPCISLHPRMPLASEQGKLLRAARDGPLVVRWNLHQGYAYDQAKARFQPFTQLVDEDIPNRVAVARLCLEAVAEGHRAYVIANNKAEGSAPLTLFKLAEQIASLLAPSGGRR